MTTNVPTSMDPIVIPANSMDHRALTPLIEALVGSQDLKWKPSPSNLEILTANIPPTSQSARYLLRLDNHVLKECFPLPGTPTSGTSNRPLPVRKSFKLAGVPTPIISAINGIAYKVCDQTPPKAPDYPYQSITFTVHAVGSEVPSISKYGQAESDSECTLDELPKANECTKATVHLRVTGIQKSPSACKIFFAAYDIELFPAYKEIGSLGQCNSENGLVVVDSHLNNKFHLEMDAHTAKPLVFKTGGDFRYSIQSSPGNNVPYILLRGFQTAPAYMDSKTNESPSTASGAIKQEFNFKYVGNPVDLESERVLLGAWVESLLGVKGMEYTNFAPKEHQYVKFSGDSCGRLVNQGEIKMHMNCSIAVAPTSIKRKDSKLTVVWTLYEIFYQEVTKKRVRDLQVFTTSSKKPRASEGVTAGN